MFKRTEYSNNTQITNLRVDNVNEAIWVAFAKNTDGNVILQRQSGFDVSQTFFNLTRSVDKLVESTIDSNFLYVAYEDSTLLGEIISLTNPLTTTIQINRPISLVENPIDIATDGTYLFFLMPGIVSGLNSKVLQYTLLGVFVQTIDILTITDASSITADNVGDLWIYTNTVPTNRVRLFPISGGLYDIQIN